MLTVVTHTRNDRPELLKRSAASVEAALVPGVKHRIIECLDDWGKARLDAMALDEYVCFVDDDDTVEPDALRICLDVAKQQPVGVIVTTERKVDISGKELSVVHGVKEYAGIRVHPTIIHHLCLIKTAAVDSYALDLHRKYGVGADWAIKASAALTHDAIHVPIVGYNWTQHEDTMNVREKKHFQSVMYQLGLDIRNRWKRQDLGRLPVWKL